MIRVLQVIGTLANGGMESFILNIYRHINRDQIQFDFVVGSKNGWCETYAHEIESMGGKVIFLPTNLQGLIAFYRLLRGHSEYQVVHAHRDAMSTLFLMVAMLVGLPVRISHSHNAGATGFMKRTITQMIKPVLNIVATKRLACGKEAGDFLFGNHSYRIVPNAIDIKKFLYDTEVMTRKRIEIGIPPQSVVIGHVGRFEYQKNHAFLIDIFREICQKIDHAVLLLIGSGSLKGIIEKKVADAGLASKVVFLEQRFDINELLSAMDVVVFPSYYEGFSMAMVEMQASGLPILCSDFVPHEINITGKVEFASIKDNPRVWADKVLEIVANDVRADGHVEKLYKAGLDIESSVEIMQKIYTWKRQSQSFS